MSLRSLVNLLSPPRCLLCHRDTSRTAEVFCELCAQEMPSLLPPACQRCGVGLSGAYDARTSCQRCQTTSFTFELARAPLVYTGPVREAIHAFKYHGHHRIGSWLAHQMMETAKRHLPLADIDLILPVPMHWLKQRVKGVNPAETLAQAVSQRLDLPYATGLLRRIRWTASQTRLSLRQRARNVQGAFRAHAPRVVDRTILLVDDVLTSGATAQACATALQAAGAPCVFVLTAACAPGA